MKIEFVVCPGKYEWASVVNDLPSIGDIINGHVVASLEPCPYAYPQPVQDVYRYAIWNARYEDTPECSYLAIHEAEAESI